MILSYVIKNYTNSDFPLECGEAWKFIVSADDEYDAYMQMEKVKLSAGMHRHDILNVYLNGANFDAREYWTDGANSDDFEYDELVSISRVHDETKTINR
jgi:hypothetical protein